MNFKEIKTEEDIKELASLAENIWREYWTSRITSAQTEYMIEKFQSFKAIKHQIEDENYIYNIFYDAKSKSVIGYFGISPQEDCLFLSKLYIKHDFRGFGCGNLAFNRIKLYAVKYNKTRIKLTVNKYNTQTIKVYEKWGFRNIKSVVSDIGSGFVMDDYIMEYVLREKSNQNP